MRLKGWLPVLVVAAIVASMAIAETVTTANQGRPGNQGCWPVCIGGPVVVVGPDGGPVNVYGTVIVDGGHITVTGPDGGPVPVTQASFPWFVTGPDGGALDVTVRNPDGGPVSVSVSVSIDGGTISTFPGQCMSTLPDGGPVHKSTALSNAGAVNCPASQAPNRQYIVFCMNQEQGVGGRSKIRIDGVDPIIGGANPGDVLERGDCILYPIASSVVPRCISNGNHNLASFECIHAP